MPNGGEGVSIKSHLEMLDILVVVHDLDTNVDFSSLKYLCHLVVGVHEDDVF